MCFASHGYPRETPSIAGSSTLRLPMAALALSTLLALFGCGGGAGGDVAPPPVPAGIGPAGGTVTGPAGSKVVVPAGALSTSVDIAIAETGAGAPALPAGVTSAGPTYAFTPHGTQFASAVTITVPFNPASVPSGGVPTLYKTNAGNTAFTPVTGASISGNTMSGQVSGFSYATVAVPPTPTTAPIVKTWLFEAATATGAFETIAGNTDASGALLDEFRSVGRALPVVPPTASPTVANFMAYSNESGRTFYTSAIAPHTLPFDAKPYVSAISDLTQVFTFEVQDEPPSLQFLVTRAHMESLDYGGNIAGPVGCPWLPLVASVEQIRYCESEMTNAIDIITFRADSVRDNGTFYSIGGFAKVNGRGTAWKPYMFGYETSWHSLWSEADFDVDMDADRDGAGRHVVAKLKQAIPVVVPVAHLRKGDLFSVTTTARSIARNLIQGESFVGAYVRDPAATSGLGVTFTGLKLIPPRTDIPSGSPAVPCATGPDPSAGELRFSDARFSAPEGGRSLLVNVERIGGTRGVVGAVLRTADGSARAGTDYQVVDLNVRFADGEAGQRAVAIPLLADSVIEPDEILTATLSQPGGCATLGSPSSVTLTILDDDTPPTVPQSYTVGGTVAGLVGSGLVLRETSSGNLPVANGAFTFGTAVLTGLAYDVRVQTQPTNPIQVCSVANGTGTMGTANVTNVAVTCVTPAPNGSLDPAFGTGGKVASNIAFVAPTVAARMGMALQADGRILLVGALKLARFNSDGTADASFGVGGVATVPFNGSPNDFAQGVAVQSDGRIVVVGTLSVGGATAGKQDFALARFNANGTVDTGFGNGGVVTTDFDGSQDVARRIAIQADGKLLVAGFSTIVRGAVAENQYALARYNADGSADVSFANGLGRTTTGFGGTINWAQGLTVQRNGRIVVAGRTAVDGGSDPRVGVARYLGANTLFGNHIVAAGSQDEDFNDPDFDGPLLGGQIGTDLNVGGWEEAVDVVEHPGVDGQLLVATRSTLAGKARFGLATFINRTDTNTGRVYGGYFPSPLQPTLIDFSGQSDEPSAMAIQSDGKVLMVGRTDIFGANPNMGIARFVPGSQQATIDTSFGSAGMVTVDFFGSFERAEAVAVQSDGKIVVGGYARNGGTTVFAVVRLMP